MLWIGLIWWAFLTPYLQISTLGFLNVVIEKDVMDQWFISSGTESLFRDAVFYKSSDQFIHVKISICILNYLSAVSNKSIHKDSIRRNLSGSEG